MKEFAQCNIIIQKTTQMPRTECINNMIGYAVDQDPGPMIVVYPKEKNAEFASNRRIQQMTYGSMLDDSIDDCKVAKDYHRPKRPPVSGSGAIAKLKLPNGTERYIHVCEIQPGIITTSFGTFKRVNDKWLWVCDQRYSLSLMVSA